jgi:hypothetical protein
MNDAITKIIERMESEADTELLNGRNAGKLGAVQFAMAAHRELWDARILNEGAATCEVISQHTRNANHHILSARDVLTYDPS